MLSEAAKLIFIAHRDTILSYSDYSPFQITRIKYFIKSEVDEGS